MTDAPTRVLSGPSHCPVVDFEDDGTTVVYRDPAGWLGAFRLDAVESIAWDPDPVTPDIGRLDVAVHAGLVSVGPVRRDDALVLVDRYRASVARSVAPDPGGPGRPR